MIDQNPFDDMPVIYSYSRAQAIEDGVLVDLTEWARETGFTVPVACTAAVWNGHIVPADELRELGQSERGRCHDVLWTLQLAIRRQQKPGADTVMFDVIFLQPPAPGKQVTVRLKSMCGPGDAAEPVVTIMLPDED